MEEEENGHELVRMRKKVRLSKNAVQEEEEEEEAATLPKGDFTLPLSPHDLVENPMATCRQVLREAAKKYPYAAHDLAEACTNNLYAALFWTLYYGATDPVLQRLTQAEHPEFAQWLHLYHRAFVATLLPYGLNVFAYVGEVFYYISCQIYLPQSASRRGL